MEEKKEFGLVTRAARFAAKAHDGQVRKGTDIPYIVHPMEAAAIAAGMSDDPAVIAAALLHDTMEDAGVTREQIASKFGVRVADLVSEETENKRVDQKAEDTWQLRKQETIDHLRRTTDRDVKILALADKLSNLRTIYRDFKEMGDELWERFNQKDPARIGWYYRSFEETCADLAGTAAYTEYVGLLDTVFGQNR